MITIRVNLYSWKEKGSLTVCEMIADDTWCQWNSGVWNGPAFFYPEDTKQAHAVTDLLKEFELEHYVQ
jgi:hypothetical protein